MDRTQDYKLKLEKVGGQKEIFLGEKDIGMVKVLNL